MKSITKLMDDDCQRIVEENANKIGFSKAFEEMKFCVMPKPAKYGTRSKTNIALSPEQRQMEKLWGIFNVAFGPRLRKETNATANKTPANRHSAVIRRSECRAAVCAPKHIAVEKPSKKTRERSKILTVATLRRSDRLASQK